MLPDNIDSFINIFTLVVVIVYIARFIQKLIEYSADKNIIKQEEQGKKTDASAIRILSNIAKWAIWLIASLFILQNAGVDISALVAGAGIAGIAIAFALQEVLADLFACFSIYFDKPFEVGDFVVIEGGESGTVKKIGLKSTRIKSLKGDEMIVSNKKLTESVLHNYKKMEKRRAEFEISVDPKTSVAKLKKGKEIISKIIEDIDDTEFNRVHLKTFNGNSWTYIAVYFVTSSKYEKYMDAQEGINLEIRKVFDKEKIKFATDTQKIILKD
jgi:small-conductance mechanosensitive channel